MKTHQIITIIIICLANTHCRKAENNLLQKERNDDSLIIVQKKKTYQPLIDSIVNKYQFNGIIRVGYKDELVYEKANGYSNFEDSIKHSGKSTFAIASISKQFTSAIILQLVDQQKLNLEDRVSEYLDEFKSKEKEAITVRQLLNHTSGIVDHGINLASKPGRDFNYSNKGFYYLQKLIEKLNDEKITSTIGRLKSRNNFKELKTSHDAVDSLFSFAYLGKRTKPQRVQNMPKRLSNSNISIGAGGIITTAEDLQIWNYKLYRGGVFSSQSLKQFITKYSNRPHPILGTMGYGLGIMMNLDKPQCYFHSGYVKGAPSLNMYYPQSKISVIVLSNFADESLGKKAIFKPHLELKKLTDSLENTY